ncbi:MAG: TIGR03435 family protein [Verrucomicrobiota bacterium]|jgi:uncharacterized protein (TIGR03435 family)
MQELEDIALLREYLERESEEAFAALVIRHVNKVYSVALRQTGNPHSAEEITQAVFVLLARNARRLGRRVILSGWLYQTARLKAVAFIRGAIRRARREQEAHMQTIVNKNESEVWPEIAPLLDAAMTGLNETDRQAVVLRYFDGKSLKEVGAALDSNEEAAKKRMSRALDKLRTFLTKHGVHSTTAIIADTISANAVQAAPVALAKSVSAAATAQGAAAGSSTSALLKGTLKLMAWTKLKTAAVAGVVILLAAGTAVVAVKTRRPAAINPAEVEKMWGEYAQAMAISGPTADGAIHAAVQVMRNHPPMASIRLGQRRPLPGPRGGGRGGGIAGVGTAQGHIYMGAFLGQVIRYAYDLDPQFPQARIIVPLELQGERFDYVDTMPQGGKEVLQRALKDQFGIVARQEMRKNLVMMVKNAAAAGLQKHTEDGSTTNRSVNVTMAQVADQLSRLLGVEVTDQTGLAGGFDFTLSPRSPATEDLKEALLDQLGLELTPAADSPDIEFIVCEKVR